MSKEKTTKLPDIYQKTAELLKRHPELAVKLHKALETERFFLTLTCQFKDRPEDKNDLHHFWIRNKFSIDDSLRSMQHIENDFKAKEMPTSEIKDDGNWH